VIRSPRSWPVVAAGLFSAIGLDNQFGGCSRYPVLDQIAGIVIVAPIKI